MQLGKELLEKIVNETADNAVVEQPPKFEGRTMIMILASK
jgi:translation initiation factor IF-3